MAKRAPARSRAASCLTALALPVFLLSSFLLLCVPTYLRNVDGCLRGRTFSPVGGSTPPPRTLATPDDAAPQIFHASVSVAERCDLHHAITYRDSSALAPLNNAHFTATLAAVTYARAAHRMASSSFLCRLAARLFALRIRYQHFLFNRRHRHRAVVLR